MIISLIPTIPGGHKGPGSSVICLRLYTNSMVEPEPKLQYTAFKFTYLTTPFDVLSLTYKHAYVISRKSDLKVYLQIELFTISFSDSIPSFLPPSVPPSLFFWLTF